MGNGPMSERSITAAPVIVLCLRDTLPSSELEADSSLGLIGCDGGTCCVLFLIEVGFLDFPIRHRTIDKVIRCLSPLEVGWFNQR